MIKNFDKLCCMAQLQTFNNININETNSNTDLNSCQECIWKILQKSILQQQPINDYLLFVGWFNGLHKQINELLILTWNNIFEKDFSEEKCRWFNKYIFSSLIWFLPNSSKIPKYPDIDHEYSKLYISLFECIQKIYNKEKNNLLSQLQQDKMWPQLKKIINNVNNKHKNYFFNTYSTFNSTNVSYSFIRLFFIFF